MGNDIEVLQAAFNYTVETAEKLLSVYVARTGKNGQGARRPFLLGFVLGLKEALEEQRAENAEWALVLVKPQEVQKEADAMQLRRRREIIQPSQSWDPGAYSAGTEHGRRHNVNRPAGMIRD